MKTVRPERHDPRAVVLIVVLASLVLLSILVVAFVSSVGTELKSSKIYSTGSSVKLLAQSAVNLVQAEINDATHDGSLCWVSQPGMIRTFDNTGNPVKYYKLYSDDAMISAGAYNSATGLPPNDWYNRKGVYVDLNQPVTISGANGDVNHYPIVDGNNSHLTSYTPSPLIGPVKALAPIDTTLNTPQVAGFWIKNAPLPPSTANQAPMPVKWLYVLRDGTFLTPDSTLNGNGAVTFTGQQPDNDMKEIVGRIAFWTDDETSKVNLNTAAEGAAVWDVPRFKVTDYKTLASSQPYQNEFQRYPGHPATVSLSAVFGNLAAEPGYPENIYPLTPRITSGGSLHGTVPVKGAAAAVPLNLRTDRLYDTVDEFMFQNNRGLNSALLSSLTALDQAKIEQARFFATACSRAPDVNLFNQPRVSMWPVSSAGTGLPHRSPKDQLIAFCSTIDNLAYYFQRLDPNDPHTDLPGVQASDGTPTGLGRNRQLLEYLRNLMSKPIPGFGGNFRDKYNSVDQVPGTSGISGQESDQILTEIFDYIRTTNLKDQSIAYTTGSGKSATTINEVNPYTPAINPSATYPYVNAGVGQVVPILDQTNGTKGFGRFPTLQQAALIFYASKDDGLATKSASQMSAFFVLQFFDPAIGYPWAHPYYRIQVTGLGGFLWDSQDATTTMFTQNTAMLPSPDSTGFNLHPMTGGVVGWRRLFHRAVPSSPTWAPFFSTPYPKNDLNVSYAAAAPAGLGLTGIRFKGGPIKIEIFQNTLTGPGKLIQTVNLTMPDAPASGFPLPALSPAGTVANPPPPATQLPPHVPAWENWANRWSSESENSNFGEILSNNDVIRSVVATPGDMRLIAARRTIDENAGSTFFKEHPVYANTAQKMAHNLQTSYGNPEYRASMTATGGGGRLVALTTPNYDGYGSAWNTNCGGQEYKGMGSASLWSDVPASGGVFVGGGASGLPGDWDNGAAAQKDGAYINKPDEGDIYTTSLTSYFGQSYGAVAVGQTFFSPNRMIPSSGMLGSLPTGVLANRPWQTLLFRPGPAGHPGLGTSKAASGDSGPPYTISPDHLLMDLFTMPVVEPYAISEPLATAGRINMNYQIVPFTYITRNTGLQAALKGVQVLVVPDADADKYKFDSYKNPMPPPSAPYRQNVDIMKTLAQFEARFARNDVFRSATEICSVDLIPSNYSGVNPPTRASMDTYWQTRRLTGDDSRERPYTNLYPLLTTKSNTFTIHFRVQTLKKVRASAANYAVWREGADVITGEYRGSQTIERYVDANNAADRNGNPLPNFADPANYSATLNPYYKFRVISTRQFAP